ncbi:hypothetical protein EW146_g10065 [Bondarzewia mesenterica]|uniref:Uncharacterized protein n=1 Tax=Bondarzewia mesenterica TaxID=1095465 RepID=A0A4S4L0S5_9AGAM|nr:hypothetical protein EW146_g10065 [Bondarzewia mesenterica]
MANSQFQDHHEQTFVNDLDLWMAEMSQMDVDFDRVYPLRATLEDNLQQQNVMFLQQQTMLLQSPPLLASYNLMHSSVVLNMNQHEQQIVQGFIISSLFICPLAADFIPEWRPQNIPNIPLGWLPALGTINPAGDVPNPRASV